jgi:D-alanyl-D-alanine carboxypeptidase
MKRASTVLVTALSAGFFTQALVSPGAAAAQRAVNPAISARIDRLALSELRARRTPGIAIGIVEDGRVVYARGFGFANLASHSRMTPETEFYVGGLTMQFTAAAILLLAQDGKLHLDDRVEKYVPGFRLGGRITIAQLLTQTSGLAAYARTARVSLDPSRPLKLSDVFAALDRANAATSPPTTYADSPLNYLIAGVVVERASGVPLSDYLEQHVFIPLVMDHTFLAGDSGISPSHAFGYTRTGRGFVPAATWDPSWLAGYSGLVSTIYDLTKWSIEMPVLLRIDAVRTMFAPTANNGPTHYGMGWVIDRRGGKDFMWCNGEISGYRAMIATLPEQHVGVIVFSNVDSLHGRPVTIPEELGARILDILVPPATAHLDNAIVAQAKEWLAVLASRRLNRSQLTGTFSAYLTDDLVARENFAALGQLRAIVPISSTTESNGDTLYEFLVQYSSGQYHYEFELTPNGKIDGITLRA